MILAGIVALEAVVIDKRIDRRVFWELNFFDKSDVALLLAIGDGRFAVDGLWAMHLGSLLGWRLGGFLNVG